MSSGVGGVFAAFRYWWVLWTNELSVAGEGMSQARSPWESAWVIDPFIFPSKSITHTLMRENVHQSLHFLLDFGSKMEVDRERKNIKGVLKYQSFYDFIFLLTVLSLYLNFIFIF